MNGHRDYHTKRSQSVRERQISYDIIYMWNQKKEKKIQINSFLKQRLKDIENKLTVTDGKRGIEEG